MTIYIALDILGNSPEVIGEIGEIIHCKHQYIRIFS